MLFPKSLTFQNIGPFIEPQTIDFTKLGSLSQIEGQNNQTSGSSAAGKSTILKAHDWLLGLDGPATTILQSRLTKDHIVVSGTYDYDGIPITIERGRKLSIKYPDRTIEGSSKITEEELDKIIGMDRSIFRKILHKRQGEGGWFLNLGATETHKFLTKCLNLQKEQAKVDRLDLILADLSKKEVILKSKLESSNTGLEATKNALSSLGEAPVNVYDPSLLENLKQTHVTATENHKLVLSHLRSQAEEFEKSRPQFETQPYDRNKIIKLESDIADINSQIGELEKKENERQSNVKAKISELQAQANKLEHAELTRQGSVKNQISAKQLEVAKLQGIEQNRQSTVKSTISSLQVESIKNQSLISQGKKAVEEATALAKELQKVRESLCPTCEQNWVNDAAKAKETQILSKISEYKKTVIAGNEASSKNLVINEQLEILKGELNPKEIPELTKLALETDQLKLELNPKEIPEVLKINKEIEVIRNEIQPKFPTDVLNLKTNKNLLESILNTERREESEHQRNENIKKQVVLDEFAQKQAALRKEHQDTIQFAQEAEYKAHSELKSFEQHLKSFEESKVKFEESNKKLSLQFNQYHESICLTSADLVKVQEELELVTESKQVIKSYLSCSFESALESIGDAATRRIRRIPNMASGTIQFDGIKETAAGKVKEEVNCVLSMNGEIGIPVKSLCGGERSSVDLAIDLSVIEFIEETTQKGISIMELDECFTGLDTVNIIEALEMLKDSCSGKQLLLIDHNPVAAQHIESKILVVRTGQTSHIAL